jgi:hypothetical protein
MGEAGRTRARDGFGWPRAAAIVSDLQRRINIRRADAIRMPVRAERGV